MANPTSGYFPPTGDRVIDGVTHGYYWMLQADRTVDWSITGGWYGEGWNDPTALKNALEGMLGTFSYYANIRFNFVGYGQTPANAHAAGSEINFAPDLYNVFFSGNSQWARAFFPESLSAADYYYGEAGDVYLNTRSLANYLPSYSAGSAGWFVFIHEIGHALGLKHPHDSGGTGRPTLSQLGLGQWDVDYGTIMSYDDDYNWNLVTWDPYTPMILDVLALQYLYGKNMYTNAGNTLYGLSANGAYLTYWDASGRDEISAASQSSGWLIVMPEARMSTLVDTRAGFAAPISDLGLDAPTSLVWFAGDYEDATGSAANDIIVGNSFSNVLRGGGGDDGIGGGDGIDYAFYSGNRATHITGVQSDGDFTVAGGINGSDSLFEVERLVFADTAVAIDFAGNAGMTVKLLGALLGPWAVHDRSLVGLGLDLFDSGMTYTQVADYGLSVLLGAGRTDAAVINLLWGNTAGTMIPQQQFNVYANALGQGLNTQAGLAVIFAEWDVNLANVGFMGLQQTGVAYL